MLVTRRAAMRAAGFGALGLWLGSCGDDRQDLGAPGTAAGTTGRDPEGEPTSETASWSMPAEEARHETTWMCFPGRADVWGSDLGDVQATIAEIGLTVAGFEPVRMLVRPADIGRAQALVGSDIDLIEAPVDDLWARDTLPLFVVSDAGDLAAARVQFNGWGGKQVHDGDATLAGLVAEILGVGLIDSGLVGEGGGLETDGDGTLLAARSSWVNDNRNPGLDEQEIAGALVELLGADRLLWVDGLAGKDITDGHIDTLARFTDPATIIHELPAYVEAGDAWYDLAVTTAEELGGFRTADGDPYQLIRLQQPAMPRRNDPQFLASYVNYYVCNDAVLVPQFGDAEADDRAKAQIGERYPGREVVALDIDPVSAGGGGIHCTTQQQPAV